MITDQDLRLIKNELITLIGTDLGQYKRPGLLPNVPAIHNGRKAPAGYRVITSPELLGAGETPLPALEVIFDRYALPSSKIRNCGSAPIIDEWQLFLLFHDDRSRSDLVLQRLVRRYKVPLALIDHLAAEGQDPEQYRLPIINWQ